MKKGIIRRVIIQSGATSIVHGDCRGADKMAGEIATSLDIPVFVFPAEWERFGNRAGPMRNQAMLNTVPDLVIAFHDDIEKSKGTKDMVARARRAGIPVKIISGTE
jgi:hypothetical protein